MTKDPFADQIKETVGYSAVGRGFTNLYAARRAVAEDKLRIAMQETRDRLPSVINPVTSSLPIAPSQLEDFDSCGDELRDWLIQHVHTLLPALQLAALANPPSHAVETEA